MLRLTAWKTVLPKQRIIFRMRRSAGRLPLTAKERCRRNFPIKSDLTDCLDKKDVRQGIGAGSYIFSYILKRFALNKLLIKEFIHSFQLNDI